MQASRVLSVFVVAALLLPAMYAGDAPAATDDFLAEQNEWRSWRDERLRSESGWLSLVGLTWLEPGENRFGAAEENDMVLPSGPGYVGSFFLEDDVVRLVPAAGTGLAIGDEPATEKVLRADVTGEPDVLRLGSLSMFVILRDGRYGIRARDAKSPVILSFEGMEYYPPDPAYRVEATFVPYEPEKKLQIATATGPSTVTIPGQLRFTIDGEEMTLDPIQEKPEDDLFVIFKDRTSGRETYGAGRYMYTAPAVHGKVTLDFNKAYNPPCVFTPYATCPFPPKQNVLPVPIPAGEKNYRAPGSLTKR